MNKQHFAETLETLRYTLKFSKLDMADELGIHYRLYLNYIHQKASSSLARRQIIIHRAKEVLKEYTY